MKIAVSIVIGAALLTSGCGKEPQKTEAAAPAPVAVKTVVLQEIEWPTGYEATGTVKARVSATLSSRVMGYIREMRVKAGDRVQAGQLIAVIDSRDLEAGLGQAQAAVDEAKSGIAEADNAIAAAKAQLDLASVTFKRMQDLYDKKSISDQEYDEATSRRRVAQAGYEVAVAKRRQLDARIRQAEQGAHAAEVTRGYAQIHAPFSGVVTDKRAEQGDMAAPGTPLVTVEQAGAYQLEAPVEEARLPVIRAGQPVTVVLDAFDRTLTARINEIVPAIDPGSRSFVVKIALPADARLHSGMFGRVRFTLSSRRTVAVPESAIAAAGQVRTVSVVENGVARSRLVSLGERNGNFVEILSGVSAGETIVAPRPANLLDGAKVEVRL